MSPRVKVGKSGVTPCKHDLFNKLLGREVGSLIRNRLSIKTYQIVDLTAGDGVPYGEDFTKGCSPGIILKHAKYIAEKTQVGAIVSCIERQPETCAALRRNFRSGYDQMIGVNPRIRADVFCHDAKAFRFRHTVDAAFIYNDPNHIEDWCLSAECLESAPKFTTSLSTLGCNVGGLKRIDLEKRQLWFERIDIVVNSILQPWHDACLFSVGGADQWAYLVTAPMTWRERITTDCLAAAAKVQGKIADPRVAWFKSDPDKFLELQKFLFYTKSENAQ